MRNNICLKAICTFILITASLAVASAGVQSNLIINSDFETGTTSWYGQKLSGDHTEDLPAPEMIDYETTDTWNGSAGSLRVTIAKDPQYDYYSHGYGAICQLNENVPAGTILQVSFYAKSVSGGTRINVSRVWGGGSMRVPVTTTWELYHVYVPFEWDAATLVFSLVPSATGDIQVLDDGVFLLDQVTAVAVQPEPSILFCSPQGLEWGWIDLQYLNELHAKGFEVDYTNSLSEVTWDRIKQYNAVVLYATPETWVLWIGGTPHASEDNQQFINVIEQYLDYGGGVFLFPREMNIRKQMLEDFTTQWGAKLPIEEIVENVSSNEVNLAHASYPVPLAWTDQVFASPVSTGVTQLWYPISPAYNASHSGPIEVDTNWQVVVTASLTSQSQPIDLSTGHEPPANPYQRPGGVTAPALMAIRSYKAGRVALLNQWSQYTIGSGVKWIYDRQVLSTGADGRPSHWETLLENTFNWLIEPSLQSGAVGGYFTPPERLLAPNDQPAVRALYEYNATWDELQAQWNQPPQYATVYRGLIGAKTTYSSGTGTVQQYAQAAKASGLEFIVFLDDFDKLTQTEFEQLKTDCHTYSDSQVLLIPGFTIEANTGDRMFFFSLDGAWPPPNVLTGPDNTLYNLQPQDTNGKYTGYCGDSYMWSYNEYSRERGNIGYYHFTGSPSRMKISDLRLYGMAALRYYKDGDLVEDVTSDYLTCAQGTFPPVPVSFNEVLSPEALIAEAESKHALTYVRANSVDTIFADGLYWPWQDITFNTFMSEGPLIHAWSETWRDYTLGAEEFVTQPAILPARMEVTAANGIKEIAIYNGRDLFRRLEFSKKQTEFSTNLMLNKSVQKNLVLIVTDRKGLKAVSFALRCWKDSGREVCFCSDHVNDCKSGGMLLALGPTPMLAHWVVPLPYDIAGYTWDGGPPANLPLVWFGESRPLLESGLGSENANRFNQTPLLEFTDEGASAVSSEQNELFSTDVIAVVNYGHTFGPLGGPSKLFSAVLRYREYLTPTIGVPEVSYAGLGVRQGINVSLFRSEITFKADLTVNSLRLLTNNTAPKVSPIYFAYGQAPATVTQVLDLSKGASQILTLSQGDWFAIYSGGTSASHIFIVREQPVQLYVASPDVVIWVYANLAGTEVAKGSTHAWELFSLGIPPPIYEPLNDLEGITSRLAYLAKPAGMQILRGTRVNSPGFIEISPSSYAAEVLIPKPDAPNDLTLPLRVSGLNRRWTAGLLQKKGYVKGDYGTGDNRYREVGVDVYGYAYVPMYPNPAPETHMEETHMLVGHPITADGAGSSLFIQVTHLYDNPAHWHISLNNPTDQPIKTTLSQQMALPGLAFPTTTITLKAGEYRSYATIYNVGPGQSYSSLCEVPWLDLLPGDTVNIHWKPEPYREIIGLQASGTAFNPIRICGVKGPNGELPVLSGENAVIDPSLADFFDMWNENLGIFVFQGPWGSKPSYIEIEGLKIIGANPQNSFTNENREVMNYAQGAAAIYVVVGENITIRGCEITENGNGIFTNSNNDVEERTTRNMVIENNYIYGNGNAGSYRHHNLYIQSAGNVVQYNRIGRLRAGAIGSSLKDRSAGTVIRYNWIESAARTLDLVEPEDAAPVLEHPDYHKTFVYGNILINQIDDNDGYAYAGNMVHYGGDNSVSGDDPPTCDICRKGTLYFFNNTVVIIDTRPGGGSWRQVHLFELSTHDETTDITNNIMYLNSPNGETHFALMDAYGVANLEGVNWIVQGWEKGHWRDFAGQVNVIGALIEGTNPQFSDDYYHLVQTSSCIDAGDDLPAAITQKYMLDNMYKPHSQGIERITGGARIDLGAYEYVLPLCNGDFDMDKDVDGIDLAVLAEDFGRTDCCEAGVFPCEGDFDSNCNIDRSDLAIFAPCFGRTDCP